MFFTTIYVFLPGLFALYVFSKITLDVLVFYPIILIIYGLLTADIWVNEYFKKIELLNIYKEKSREKIESIKREESAKGRLVKKYEEIYKKRKGVDYTDLHVQAFEGAKKLAENRYLQIIFSFILILSFLYSTNDDNIIVIGSTAIITFFGLSMIAFANGYRNIYYPPAKIILDSGETIQGKIIKFGDYIYLIEGNKKIFVNKDKVKFVEWSKFKEKEDDNFE